MTPETLPFAPPRPVIWADAPARPQPTAPDLAVAALPLLERAADALRNSVPAPARWRVPAAHFFHGPKPTPKPTPHDILDDVLCLMGSVEVRHAARAVGGLTEAARLAAPHCRAAAKLLAALELVDDEVVRISVPATSSTVRIVVRGVPDFARLGELLADRLGHDWQFVHPRAVTREGGLRPGVESAGDWFWGNQPLARLPRVCGERHVVAVPATVAMESTGNGLPHVVAELDLLDEVVPAARRAA